MDYPDYRANVVAAGGASVPKKLESRMRSAEKSGNRLEMLKTMRVMLAERFDAASIRDTAALSRQLQIVCDQIAELEGVENANSNEKVNKHRESWTARKARAANRSEGPA